jgi:hypothetical protein
VVAVVAILVVGVSVVGFGGFVDAMKKIIQLKIINLLELN